MHVCCAPCACYVLEKLTGEGFNVTAYFYNPNIYPESEYQRRLDELRSFSLKKNLKLVVENPDFDRWNEQVQPFEAEPEGGLRCRHCYEIRLEQTAKYAKFDDTICLELCLQ